jgi:hypothetical protein
MKAKDRTRITAAAVKFMRRTVKYTFVGCKRNKRLGLY